MAGDLNRDRLRARRKLLAALAALGVAPLAWNALRPGIAHAVPTPLATAANACTLSPAMTEGPYFVDERLNRADLTAGATHAGVTQGLPLILVINLVSARGTGCLPLAGVQLDLWQADALGTYSEFGTAAGQKFLRGYQVSGPSGQVTFKTIYPGWYPGRAFHIHAKARVFNAAGNRTFEFNTQLFFDEAVNDAVNARTPYNTRGTRDTRNANDAVYNGRSAALVNLQPMQDGTPGFIGVATVALDIDPGLAALNFNQAGLTGHWFDPSTVGQGFGLEIFPNQGGAGQGQAFGAWFTYDSGAPGGVEKQRWYTFSGPAAANSNVIPVQIYRNYGGNFNAGPLTAGVNIGSGTLSFSTCTTGQLMYAFGDGSGRAGVIPMQRLAPNVTCAASAAALPLNPDFAMSGSWFNPATSGQGFTIEVNPNAPILFFSWYTYALNGGAQGAAGQRWFTAQGEFQPGQRSVSLTIYQTTGGIFDQGTYPPPHTQALVAGRATLNFMSCTRASLFYNFTAGPMAGALGTIALQRVGPTPPGCIG
jgi:protocatechuate 3,4-dioxygenase beta subunit